MMSPVNNEKEEKPRANYELYIALYPKQGSARKEDKYHWIIIIEPEPEPKTQPQENCVGVRYHFKDVDHPILDGPHPEVVLAYAEGSYCDQGGPELFDSNQCLIERREFSPGCTPEWIARILVGEVEDLDCLELIIETAPDPKNRDCAGWVRNALKRLVDDRDKTAKNKALCLSNLNWEGIRDKATKFAEQAKKRPHGTKPPTYSMLSNMELV